MDLLTCNFRLRLHGPISQQNMLRSHGPIEITICAQVALTYMPITLALRLHGPILIWEINAQYKGLNTASKRKVLTKGSHVEIYRSEKTMGRRILLCDLNLKTKDLLKHEIYRAQKTLLKDL